MGTGVHPCNAKRCVQRMRLAGILASTTSLRPRAIARRRFEPQTLARLFTPFFGPVSPVFAALDRDFVLSRMTALVLGLDYN